MQKKKEKIRQATPNFDPALATFGHCMVYLHSNKVTSSPYQEQYQFYIYIGGSYPSVFYKSNYGKYIHNNA